MVQEFSCLQMRESGFSSHYEFVREAGAKTVTNNLPLLSVLWTRFIKDHFLFFFQLAIQIVLEEIDIHPL